MVKLAFILALGLIFVFGLLIIAFAAVGNWQYATAAIGGCMCLWAPVVLLNEKRQLGTFRAAIRQGISRATIHKSPPDNGNNRSQDNAELIALLTRSERLLSTLARQQSQENRMLESVQTSSTYDLDKIVAELNLLRGEVQATEQQSGEAITDIFSAVSNVRADLQALAISVRHQDSEKA